MNQLSYAADLARWYTYFHTRNDTGVVFYVGKGQGKRAYSIKKRNLHWRNIVAKHGYKIHLARTHLTEAESFEHERFLISCFKQVDILLTNLTDGGDGLSNPGAETRAKIGAAHKGKFVSKETRLKIGAASKGRVVSVETRELRRLASTGRVATPETKLKLSLAASNRRASPELKAKLSAAHLGKPLSESHRNNLVAAIRAPEVRAKIAAANLGKTASPETREKMSASHKARHAKRKALQL